MKRSIRNITAVVLVPALLAGCGGENSVVGIVGGGGGSGGGGTTITNHPALVASFLTTLDSVRTAANNLITTDARYLLQDSYFDVNGSGSFDAGDLAASPIKHAGIHYAHAAGLTGAGETIAVTDSGFRTTHEVFAGKNVTVGAGVSATDHGTTVASIAAGSSSTMIGVAPGADLILGDWGIANRTATANAAAAAGAVAYNNSWGYVGSSATTTDYNALFSSTAGTDYLNALKNYAQDGIVLFAIDNDETITNVGLMAGLPILEPDLEESWIAVVNGVPVMVGDDITSATRLSGACLDAAAWCLAADGTWAGADSTSDNSYSRGTGSSFASPTIAGSLALLAEAFPTLTHKELRIRLLASADNDFAGFTTAGSVELVPGFEHDYSTEWGHGFLDVAAALLPIGQTTMTMGSGAVVSPDQPLVVTGGASGDAVSRALRGVKLLSRDQLAGEFTVDGGAMVVDAPNNPLFTNNDVTRFSQVQDATFGSSAFFGEGQTIPTQWGDNDLSIAFYQRSEVGNDSFGIGASRRFDLDGATLEISTALGDDTKGLLSDWNGGTQSSIVSAGMALSADLSNASAISFEVGYAAGREDSGLGTSAAVLMNSAAVSFTRTNTFARNDRFNVSLSMPAAVTRGSTSLSLPVQSDDGLMTFQDVAIDLAPEQRELRLALTYERPISRTASLGLSIAHAHNHGNIAGNKQTGLLFSYTKQF
ncbi:MAG: S8 family serine peptidase [Cognatishimia sp.]|uniref:S8 family peptidase n=1 Tax=Cognatishimia sp. TaxID=2211648 RepID=UPI003B8DB05E